jgi:nucleoside-diphosphate kinase
MAKALERTLVLIKPDALQRNLIGDIITRFERKGLKIVGLKMIRLDDVILEEHYSHHKHKPFFGQLKEFMCSSPVVAIVLQGIDAVDAIRRLVGPTYGSTADVGTIRGDLAMTNINLAHAADSAEEAKKEIKRFFTDAELFEYKKIDEDLIYGD